MPSICTNENCPDIESTGLAGIYKDGLTVCPSCSGALKPVDPEALGPDEHAEGGPTLDTVGFVTDRNLLPVMRSVLQAADIPFVVRNEFDQFASVFGAVMSKLGLKVTAPAILVPSDRVDEARTLLNTTAQVTDQPGDEEE